MRASALLLLLLAGTAWPLCAGAGESGCWFEAGVLVVPAEVAGVAGDYVLDTGSPRTLLAETQAQGAGFSETEIVGDIRLAGLELPGRPVQVLKLDGRLRPLPTPVAGVIGADVLAGRVLDISFAPCRIALSTPQEAHPFGTAASLPLEWRGGRPTAAAAVSDGRRAWKGAFVVATGSDAAVRLRDDLADAPGAADRQALYPDGAARPRLRALSFAGDLFVDQPSGLTAREALEAQGEIGGPVLSRYRLRFDFAGGRLLLAKEKGPPDHSDGP